jgi:hypothetical protein
MFYRLLGIAARGINTPKSWDLLTLDLASVSDSKCKATVSSFQARMKSCPLVDTETQTNRSMKMSRRSPGKKVQESRVLDICMALGAGAHTRRWQRGME